MKRSKTILIVGGSGFVGTHLALRLRDEHKVFSTYYRHPFHIPGVTSIPFDALNRDWIKRVVYTTRPDVVIYAAGSNDYEWVEKNFKTAERVHAGGAVSVATVADILQPKYIFISNSYVFDGQHGNYHEDDIVLPTSNLGKCKLSAENFVKGKSLNYLLVRSSPLFGRGGSRSLSFLDKVRRSLDMGEKIELNANEYHSYAPVYGLVDLIAVLVESNLKNRVIHYGGLNKISPYEFAIEFAKRFQYDGSKIFPKTPESKYLSNMIFDYSLNSSFVAKTLKIKPLQIQESFDVLEKRIRQADAL